MRSARPPKAAAGNPPPITLPKVIRSGVQPSTAPSRPHPPCSVARKPVITSSLMNRAPWARQVSARKALKPGAGGTTPMLPGDASVIRHAMRDPWASKAAATAARSL